MVEDSADYIFFRLRLVRKMKYFGCHFDMSEDVEKDFRIFKKKNRTRQKTTRYMLVIVALKAFYELIGFKRFVL
jgi:hypothetical protein